ncbi:MAG: hypothetical protein SNJ77_10600 [Cytophagales bacterium]
MKRILIFLIVILALITAGVVYFLNVPYSQGVRAGVVVKLSKKGTFFKTYEGDMNLGVIVVDDTPAKSSQKDYWSFSVEHNDELIKKIEHSMLEKKRVLLRYNEKYFVLPWEGKTKYIVFEIEE